MKLYAQRPLLCRVVLGRNLDQGFERLAADVRRLADQAGLFFPVRAPRLQPRPRAIEVDAAFDDAVYGFLGGGRRGSVPKQAERRVDIRRAVNRIAREADG